MYKPFYLQLAQSGELNCRAKILNRILLNCTLCPQECKVNRLSGELGVCNAPAEPIVSSCFPHFGEERPLVGRNGSGTIFMTHCNLKCVFCQNNDISHYGEGKPIEIIDLAKMMLALQQLGCHNINFVTPTHYTAHIVSAIAIAAENGLHIPLVYNSSGYDSVETLKLLDGIIDIYMPDAKFADNETARQYTQADNYADAMYAALKEMHQQVGILQINKQGVAERGVLIRHLVMPNGIVGSERIFKFIAEELSPHSYVNIMAQYYPSHRANEFPELNRRITHQEMLDAYTAARKYGLHRGFPE
jgi:putative pyruvate formate lyase activating enzyme